MEGADLRREALGDVLDTRQRLALQAEEWLVIAQLPHQVAEREDVAVVPADRVDRHARAARLQRHDAVGLPAHALGLAQEFQDLLLAPGERLAKLGGERAG